MLSVTVCQCHLADLNEDVRILSVKLFTAMWQTCGRLEVK